MLPLPPRGGDGGVLVVDSAPVLLAPLRVSTRTSRFCARFSLRCCRLWVLQGFVGAFGNASDVALFGAAGDAFAFEDASPTGAWPGLASSIKRRMAAMSPWAYMRFARALHGGHFFGGDPKSMERATWSLGMYSWQNAQRVSEFCPGVVLGGVSGNPSDLSPFGDVSGNASDGASVSLERSWASVCCLAELQFPHLFGGDPFLVDRA
jgi:hypothetical protein